jgi:hypothetical protein
MLLQLLQQGLQLDVYLFLTSYRLFISITNYFTTNIQLFCLLSSHQTFRCGNNSANPLRILGIEELEYLRKPGLLILWISLITDSLVSLSYFKAILIEP